jgi:hypothetical protein
MVTTRNRVARLAVIALASGLGALGITAEAAAAPAAAPFNPIKLEGTSVCMQPAAPNGGAIVVKACVTDPNDVTGRAAQAWSFRRVGTHHYQFTNQLSRLCLDTFGPGADGTPMIAGECKNISNEEFNTNIDLPSDVVLETRVGFNDNGFCLTAPVVPSDGQPVTVFRCIDGDPGQHWLVGLPL